MTLSALPLEYLHRLLRSTCCFRSISAAHHTSASHSLGPWFNSSIMTTKTLRSSSRNRTDHGTGFVRIFMVGDVMLGRGVDQILDPCPSGARCDPTIYEDCVKDARDYVNLCVQVNGPLPPDRKPHEYIWGNAIEILHRFAPDARIINLETSVTTNPQPWPGKGINYRMHPANLRALSVAQIDCAVLSNNHTLDFDYPGLEETLQSLQETNIGFVGAGLDASQAETPLIIDVSQSKQSHCQNGTHPDFHSHRRGANHLGELNHCSSRIVILGVGHCSSGIPSTWRATEKKSGVNMISMDVPSKDFDTLVSSIKVIRQPGDIIVVSIHWGGNWGFELGSGQRAWARRLIDTAGVSIIHGHSSHHIKGVELYNNSLIVYGCGDFLSDYEGIQTYGGSGAGLNITQDYRDTLSFMYFADVDPETGRLTALRMVPMELKRLQVNHCPADTEGYSWLLTTMQRETERLNESKKGKGSKVTIEPDTAHGYDVLRLKF